MIYAAFRAWKTLRRYFISLPSKTAFYCVTKSREPTTNESDVFSVLACTLFVSVDDKYIVNYLNSVKTVDYIGLPEISTFSTDFKKEFLSFAQEQSHEAELNGNLRVKEKYDWLVQYIQS